MDVPVAEGAPPEAKGFFLALPKKRLKADPGSDKALSIELLERGFSPVWLPSTVLDGDVVGLRYMAGDTFAILLMPVNAVAALGGALGLKRRSQKRGSLGTVGSVDEANCALNAAAPDVTKGPMP